MKYSTLLIFSGILFSLSCKKEYINHPKSIFDVTKVAPGENCTSGGIAIKSGTDTNNDGKLDSTEVEHTEYVCNDYDKQIIIPIISTDNPVPGGLASPNRRSIYKDFNIGSYKNLDSVVLYTTGVVTGEGKGFFSLYNMTDGATIGTNEQLSGGASRTQIRSGNILNNFPEKTIDLGLEVSSSVELTTSAYLYSMYIILYRK